MVWLHMAGDGENNVSDCYPERLVKSTCCTRLKHGISIINQKQQSKFRRKFFRLHALEMSWPVKRLNPPAIRVVHRPVQNLPGLPRS